MSAVPQLPPPHLIPEEATEAHGTAKQDQSKEHTPLALPPPSQASDAAVTSVDDGVVKLDKLGPLVVNSDGTLSRIHNWETMTEAERARTLRVLNKRNQSRMEDLRKAEQPCDNMASGTADTTNNSSATYGEPLGQ